MPDTSPPRRASPGAAPRSLAEDLRSRSDDEVAALLLARPELALPVPADTTALAARASTRVAAARAMDLLDAPALQVLEVLAALTLPGLDPPSPRELARACSAPPAEVDAVLDRLRAVALVWGADRAPVPLRAAVELLGPAPGGLGPPLVEALNGRGPSRVAALVEDLGLPPSGDPVAALRAVAAVVGDRERVDAMLASAPAGARDLLERLAAGPPVGAVEAADRPVRTAGASTPVEWLLARALLAPAGGSRVVLPREVALALRGGVVREGLDLVAPPLEVTARDAGRVDAQGGGAAAEVVHLVHELLRGLEVAPVPVLRAGGMGVRELRRTAVRLEVDESAAAFVVEVARAAGLLGDDGEADPAWAPTPAYDAWLAVDRAGRWAVLARAWLATSRVPSLVGARDERGAARTALSPDLDRTAAPLVRAAVLAELAALEPGAAPGVASLAERVRWRLPRRAGAVEGRLVAATLDEGQRLGVVALGALTTAGRALLAPGVAAGRGPGDAPEERHGATGGGTGDGPTDGARGAGAPSDGAHDDDAAAAAAVRAVLPEPVDRVLLQADLTAVAPGPLVPDLAATMALVADVESRGGATVYRFSPASVRRALDAGQDGAQVLAALAAGSATPVPQALTALVDDAARRHGRLRVGVASAYLRSPDPAVLAEVLADPRAASLGLRSLAPTVAVAAAEPATVLAALRAMGSSPVVEGEGAEVLVQAPARRRTAEQQRPRPVTGSPPAPTRAQALALAAALRAADGAAPRWSGPDGADGRGPTGGGDGAGRVGGAGRPDRAGTAGSTSAALGVLRDAAATQRPVRLTVSDHAGRRRTWRAQPLRTEAGAVVVVDVATGSVARVATHRIVSVAWSAPA